MREIPDFSTARVLVAGDLMLDRYWHGATSRISPEAPVPVVHVAKEEARPGGAGNVALNVASLGAKAGLLGLVGDDPAADQLQTLLESAGVGCHLQRDARYPTITKLRIISRHQQLIRLDFEDGFPGLDEAALLLEYENLLVDYDVIVLSDYAKGTLANPQEWIEIASRMGKPLLLDPKGQDFGKYRGATLLTPNMLEFTAVAGACEDEADIENRACQLIKDFDLEHLLVTRGEHGMSLFAKGGEAQHLSTHAQEVFDVTGAGDTVIATLATGLATGLSMPSATKLANLAAGIVVGKLGTASTTAAEMQHRIQEQHIVDHGLLSEQQLLTAVRACRSRGETIVMTNGCFDILHAGHVTYLEEASRLGDRLIVALNIDAKVRALKGADRPINPLANRMRVMAALGFVDWVVAFSEDTPERLICAVQPDTLVKGGDNDPDRIPGRDCVQQAGGEVKVLSYVGGVSTTAIVDSIKQR